MGNTKHKLSFAGRDRDPRFAHEQADCTVFTFKHAFNITYKQAHDLLHFCGRDDRGGFNLDYYVQRLRNGVTLMNRTLGRELKLGGTNYRLSDFVADYPTGTWILSLRGHTLTVKDGVVLDCWNPNKHNRTIYRAYEIIKPEKRT